MSDQLRRAKEMADQQRDFEKAKILCLVDIGISLRQVAGLLSALTAEVAISNGGSPGVIAEAIAAGLREVNPFVGEPQGQGE